MFETQRCNYERYSSLEQEKLYNQSQKVVNKFNLQRKKEKDIEEVTKLVVDEHKRHVEDRFYKVNEGKRAVHVQKNMFDKATKDRAADKEMKREFILSN